MNDTDQIEVNSEVTDDATILSPKGEIDLSRAPSLGHHLTSAQSGQPTRLIVDLVGVPYMDSSGVATLVAAMQVARRQGNKIILCGMQERVRSIFEIARLDQVFTITDTREQALEA
jgi:anti-sigma B factor antagonist